ncbi:hypothetical protein FTO74_16405 [Granulicella sp. WH15]|uniref:hypothetical protein n=1 Tax=Granulicella sp. WH15 TaxID=2602070 RepID=UPI001366F62B|nr:hypothetical protein [Granulicella sp. WH15]QHN04763.1 hypothetical protein FTO74_16405 [Granulicella sp. WH15]
MRLLIVPSPSDYILLVRYRAEDFPVFEKIFEEPGEDSALRPFAQDADAAGTAVVIENRAEKEVTALRYRWIFVDAQGNNRKRTASSDSYTVDVYRPVLSSGSRLLVTQTGSVQESVLNHALAGGGTIGAGSTSSVDCQAAEVSFQIDFIMFEDGEIAGSDLDGYGSELQLRKRAAAHVAQQIRSANAENRDAALVLAALQNVPRRPDDHLARLVADYARTYLRRSTMKMGFDMKETTLRHLENRPELPKFYRRPPTE